MGKVVPLNKDGTRKRGPRWREGENYKTGSSDTRERQEEYVEWIVTPKSEREPATKQALATLLGVVPRTLGYWDRDPWVQKQVSSRTKNIAKVQNAGAVLESLYETATNLDSSRQVAAAKVYLDYIDEKVDDLSAEDLADLPNEKIAEMLADMHDLILAQDG